MIAAPNPTVSDLDLFDAEPSWHTSLAPYATPDRAKSVISVLTSVVPFLALWTAMYLALDVSYWLTLALAIPTTGFLVRTFVIFHDCTHGSLFATKRENARVGEFLGLMVFTPFGMWRHEHLVHHATAGDDGRILDDGRDVARGARIRRRRHRRGASSALLPRRSRGDRSSGGG